VAPRFPAKNGLRLASDNKAEMIVLLVVAILFPASLSAAFIPSTTTRSLFRVATSSPSSSSFSTTAGSSRTTNLSRIPIVICPGFGNDSSDYINPLNRGTTYGFINALTKRGFNPNLITTVPIKRYDWVRVACGIFDIPHFYTGTCKPTGLGYGWYIQRLRYTIEQSYMNAGQEEKVILIGHSAGGWLARAALGDGSWDTTSTFDDVDSSSSSISPPTTTTTTRASDRIRALITLGAIHKVPAYSHPQQEHGIEEDDKTTNHNTSPSRRGGPSSCVTRGALDYVNSMYPGPYLMNEGIAYISVGGDAIVGVQQQHQQHQHHDPSVRCEVMKLRNAVNGFIHDLNSGLPTITISQLDSTGTTTFLYSQLKYRLDVPNALSNNIIIQHGMNRVINRQ